MSHGMIKTGALVAAIAVGFAVTGVAAQGNGPDGTQGRGGMMAFETLDLDGDGIVTEAELAGAAEARFAEADLDGDGALSADELTAQAEARMAASLADRITGMIERFDENGDGLIQPAEMADRGPDAGRFMARFDADGDGSVSAEEFDTARSDHGGRRHGGGKNGDRHGPRDRG
ncbi:EF-hand domain-containing protein [Alexandriicola marinus]|uniref:EF-hand domain-containing protein n=1 Tax=Alexandriicola marinus TaxID=2081710 RepID=UPI001EEEB850|nr:calcium-binding protein [Alexandriicola marinus]